MSERNRLFLVFAHKKEAYNLLWPGRETERQSSQGVGSWFEMEMARIGREEVRFPARYTTKSTSKWPNS